MSFSFTASTPKSPSRRSSSTGVNSLAPLDSISSPTRRSASSTPTSGSSSLRSSAEFYQGECDRFIPSRSASNLEDAFERMDNYDPLESQSADGSHNNQNLMNNLLRSELLGEPMVALKADVSNSTNGGGINGGAVGTSVSSPSRNRTPNMLRFSSGAGGGSGTSGSSSSAGNNLGSSPLGSSRGGFGASPSGSRLSHSFSGSKKSTRKISRIPYKVLDAPALADDYYLNLVDWSSSNFLSVALASSVYLWSACNSKVTKLCDLEGGDSVTALSWALKGTYLAIGTNTGKVLLWDTVRGEQVRELQSHTSRVGTIAWTSTVLASGSRDRNIYLQDVRVPGGSSGSSERSSNARLTRPLRSTSAAPPPGTRQVGMTVSGSRGVQRGGANGVGRAHSTRPSMMGGNRPILQRGYGYDDDGDDQGGGGEDDVGDDDDDDDDDDYDDDDDDHDDDDDDDDGEGQSDYNDDGEGEEVVPVPSSSYRNGSSSSSGSRRSSSAVSGMHMRRISRRRTSNGDVDDDDVEEDDGDVRESFSLFDDVASIDADDDDDDLTRIGSHGSAMDLQASNDHASSMSVGDHDNDGGLSASPRWATDSPAFGGIDMDFGSDSGGSSRHGPLSTAAMGLAAAQLTAPSSSSSSSGGRGSSWRDVHARAAASEPSWSSHRTRSSSSSSSGARRGASSIPAAASASSISRFVPASRLLSEWPATSASHAPATAVGSFLAANTNSSSSAPRVSSSASVDYDGQPASTGASPCLVGELQAHKQEVCGLKWSYDDRMLASGGNDNKLFVWIPQLGGTGNHQAGSRTAGGSGGSHGTATVETNPVCRFGDHNAAVKAVGWSPHQHGTLASGGGTADRHIRFWNALTATPMHRIDTGSQVCNLMWSKNVNEIVSTHGYSLNQVIVWKYPSMQKVATLCGHTLRVLYLAMSPDGQSIVTGAGDETLRFWSVFPGARSSLGTRVGPSQLLPTGSDIR